MLELRLRSGKLECLIIYFSFRTSFVDVGNKDLQNGLQFLLEMFEEEALEERVNFDIISPPPQQVEECITYMASKFSLVRFYDSK